MSRRITATTATQWTAVEDALLQHYYEPDIQAARAFYASLAAHHLPGQPVWPMVVAPPGSGKTELINPLLGLPNVHLVDSVTPNTFISGRVAEPGKPKGKDGLLERVGNSASILYPDFSTVLEMQRERRGEILAQMRRIFDGRLRREFGVEGLHSEWEGRITFGVAATPEVDRHYSIFSTLGERFVMIRWGRIGGVEAALKAMNQDQAAKNDAMRHVVHALFKGIDAKPRPAMSNEVQRAIAATAEIAVRARTSVRRERNGTLEYVPEAEGTTRLAQQLCQMALGSALIDDRMYVNDHDLALVHRVAFDCMPTQRAAMLRALAVGERVETLAVPETTRRRVRDDLRDLKLLDQKGRLTDETLDLLAEARAFRKRA